MIIGKVPSVQEIGEARKQKVVVHMIVVYGDDSSDGKQKRVFAVAALIAHQEAWDLLEPQWKERTGGVAYHATDCLAGRGLYKGWGEDKSYSLHGDLTRLIVRFCVGHAFVMDLPSFAEVFGGIKRTERFLYCFSHMVGGACAIIRAYNTIHENDQNKQRAKFVFDSDNDSFNAGYLYSVLRKMNRWDELTTDCEGPVEFAFPGDKPVGIQAADIWAYEVRNEFDKTLKGSQEQSDASRLFSLEHGRFHKKEYFRTNIIEAKNKIDEMGSEPEYSLAYHQWLSKHRRRNNIGNQIAFSAYWGACLRRKENKREGDLATKETNLIATGKYRGKL